MKERFDRAKFWQAYRQQFGAGPKLLEKTATDGLLGFLEADTQIERVEWAAYILGTIRNECGANMMPVKEKKARPGTQVWIDWQSKYWHTGFYGRGYSQLTGEGNYRQFSRLLYGDDRLITNPDLVMDPAVGYKILATGCVRGMFRSRKGGARFKLADFLNNTTKDYLHARQIVNGMSGKAREHAERVADYCRRYEACLRAAMIVAPSHEVVSSADGPAPTFTDVPASTGVENPATVAANPNPPPDIVATAVPSTVDAPAEVKKTEVSLRDRILTVGGSIVTFFTTLGGAWALDAKGIISSVVTRTADSPAITVLSIGAGICLALTPAVAMIFILLRHYEKRQKAADERLMKVVDTTTDKNKQSVVIT